MSQDPSVPAPGEMQQGGGSNSSSPRLGRRSITYATADPHHHRQPSLGEIHQELENEQEAQVNRLLFMIRLQQEQLASVQRHPSEPSPSSTEQSRFPTPPSALHTPSTTMTEHSSPLSGSISGFPHPQGHFNRPHSLSRQSSTARVPSVGTNSRGTSPALHPVSGSLGPLTEDFLLGGTRDECAFYQAETQTLTRENQMLKLRIRELERQISEMSITSQSTANSAAALTHSPHQNSPLASPPTTASGEAESATTTPNEPTPA